MAYELIFFQSGAGRSPALEFLRSLPKPARAEGGWLLEQLEKYGISLDRPIVGYLEDGISELRWQIDRNEYRLLFFFHGRQIIVVTHGFSKKTQKVPQGQIEKARKLRAEWLSRG